MRIADRAAFAICNWRGHRRAADKRWDGEYYHSRCVRCGAAILRHSGDRRWRLPDAEELRYFDKMGRSIEIGAGDA